jgi:hypothetical protein
MQRNKWVAVVMMAVLMSGSYMFGRYHGSTKGAMEFPSIQVKWDSSSEESKEATEKTQEVNFVEISDAMCSGEPMPAGVLVETEAEAEVEAEESKDEESDDKTAKQ